MPEPNVEVVVVRDPSAQTWVSVYVDGVATDGRSVVIDAGHGWEWEDWRDFRDATLAEASSPACRAELIDAFDDPPGGEYVLGRDRAHWLRRYRSRRPAPGPLPAHRTTRGRAHPAHRHRHRHRGAEVSA